MCSFCTSYTHPAWGICVDDEGYIYFADIHHNEMGSVWKLSPDGGLELLFKNFHAHNVSLDSKGNLYTAHGEGDHIMIKRSKCGGQIDTLFITQNHNDFFGGNCTYAKNKIYFGIGHFIWYLDENGKRKKFNPQYLEWNQALFMSKSGSIYAPDIGIEGGVLYRLNPNGSSEIVAKNLLTKLSHREIDKHQDVLLGMGEDEDGNIYIAETAGKRIIKIAKNKTVSDFYISKGEWMPTAITFSGGETYILEYKSKRENFGPQIVKVDANGNNSVILFNYDIYSESKKDSTPTQPQKNEENDINYLVWVIGGAAFLFLVLFLKTVKKGLV
jgi:hypothetical protein